MLVCFTASPTTQASACNERCCNKEVKEVKEVSKKQKKDCCNNKTDKKTKHHKDNCNGDCNDCICCFSASLYVIGSQSEFSLSAFNTSKPKREIIPYTQFPVKSIFIEFWQPPKV